MSIMVQMEYLNHLIIIITGKNYQIYLYLIFKIIYIYIIINI